MLKKLKHLTEHIMEELDGAKEYAEKFIEHKAWGDTSRANKYKEMATDELRHASYIHEFAAQDVSRLESVYLLTEEDIELWQKANKHYTECVAHIKQMISM